MNELINEGLTTPQHEKQIDYWVSEKGKFIVACFHVCTSLHWKACMVQFNNPTAFQEEEGDVAPW